MLQELRLPCTLVSRWLSGPSLTMALAGLGCRLLLQTGSIGPENSVYLCTQSHICRKSQLTIPGWHKTASIAYLRVGMAGSWLQVKVSWSMGAIGRGMLMHK